ncbi:MAG: hypothetical protein KGK44_06110 [Gammaproteobacteria bacterium]|nr:hypothetical protein [Gammaproteobacteria bacterium]
MGAPVFIGDETAAAGYRLAGVHTPACDASGARTMFEQLLTPETPLVLIGESFVTHIGAARVSAAVTHAQPPVLVVADRFAAAAGDELPHSIRSVLGVMT